MGKVTGVFFFFATPNPFPPTTTIKVSKTKQKLNQKKNNNVKSKKTLNSDVLTDYVKLIIKIKVR